LSENLSRSTKFEAKTSILEKNFGVKLKFQAPTISSVRKSASTKKLLCLSEHCNFCLAYFLAQYVAASVCLMVYLLCRICAQRGLG